MEVESRVALESAVALHLRLPDRHFPVLSALSLICTPLVGCNFAVRKKSYLHIYEINSFSASVCSDLVSTCLHPCLQAWLWHVFITQISLY